jgi:putative xylitol transport system permease protein
METMNTPQSQQSSPQQFLAVRRKIGTVLLEYGIYVAFFLLCVILAFASPYFLLPKNLINVLRQISINGLLSIGMTFVILTGGIDLSVGSVLAFGGIVGASLVSPSMGTERCCRLLWRLRSAFWAALL